jgi:phosphoribosylaminoimidazole carboxylase (NCAIR synthetase)
MINVVGGATEPPWSELHEIDGIAVHNYNKANRPGRKLGHVTVLSDEAAIHLRTVATVRDVLSR